MHQGIDRAARGAMVDALTTGTAREPVVQPRIDPASDPIALALHTNVGALTEAHAGDLCSLLGIVGAATLALNHGAINLPMMEHLGGRIVMGSMAASALDTGIQAENVAVDDGAGAATRSNERSTSGTIAYAATGLIPATSLAAWQGLHRHPSRSEAASVALLAVNGAMFGYELLTRGPDIVSGNEDLSGYGSLLASLGGFVVAQRMRA